MRAIARRWIEVSTAYRRDGMTEDHAYYCSKVLEFIRSEIQDKTTEFDMNTPIEGVKIDSIDVIHVIFKVEEEFGVSVNLPQDAAYKTVGDFVEAIVQFIPQGSKA